MTDCKCNNKPYTIQSIHDVDIDDLATLPDYLIGVREVEDASTGTSIMSPVRVPTEKIAPNGNLANVIALDTNNSALEVPERQVLAGYYDYQPGGAIMSLADSTHPAQFLMLGKYTDGKMLVQANGFLTFPNGHQFIPGQQYYLGDEGQPVTSGTQKLFYAVTDKVLNINGDF